MVFGSFELIHAGHIHYLKRAKQMGGELVVCLYDDDLFVRYKRREPLVKISQRKEVVESIRYVDRVIVASEGPMAIMRKERPQVVVKTRTPGLRHGNRLGCSQKVTFVSRLKGESVDGILQRALTLEEGGTKDGENKGEEVSTTEPYPTGNPDSTEGDI